MATYRIVSLVIASEGHCLKHFKPFCNKVVRLCFKTRTGNSWRFVFFALTTIVADTWPSIIIDSYFWLRFTFSASSAFPVLLTEAQLPAILFPRLLNELLLPVISPSFRNGILWRIFEHSTSVMGNFDKPNFNQLVNGTGECQGQSKFVPVWRSKSVPLGLKNIGY